MKKLDLRTALVMLAVFALGYAACLAMPTAQAEQADAVEPVVIDRLLVTDYIEFANGVRLLPTGSGKSLEIGGDTIVRGALSAYGGINSSSVITADQIIARESIQSEGAIGFVDGPQIHANRSLLTIEGGNLQIGDLFPATPSYHNLGVSDRPWHVLAVDILQFFETIQLGPEVILDPARNLKNVRLDGDTLTSDGTLIADLNAAALNGHTAQDFVLKSEIDEAFCRKSCPIVLKESAP